MKRFRVSGIATISVTIDIEASSKKAALKKAREAMNSEWESDEIDGEVTINPIGSVHELE